MSLIRTNIFLSEKLTESEFDSEQSDFVFESFPLKLSAALIFIFVCSLKKITHFQNSIKNFASFQSEKNNF